MFNLFNCRAGVNVFDNLLLKVNKELVPLSLSPCVAA